MSCKDNNKLDEFDLVLADLNNEVVSTYIMKNLQFTGEKEHGMPYFPLLLPADSPDRSKPAVGHAEVLCQLYTLGSVSQVNICRYRP